MTISALTVKELREKTGVGMMDCKKALSESDGDLEKAIKFLREKGLATAGKKSERATNEGRIFIQKKDQGAAILELSCETDFVANNEDFIQAGNEIVTFVLDQKVTAKDVLENAVLNGKEFKSYISELILKVGENISIGKISYIEEKGIADYTHMNGKIGVLVAFSDSVDESFGKDIAMHIAAANPSYLERKDVVSDEIEKESEIIRSQAKNEGRPDQVIDKIVEGKINKYYKEICLLEQAFVKDQDKDIKSILPSGIGIVSFIRYSLG